MTTVVRRPCVPSSQGLYAIGQDAGGLYSDSYDMHIAEGTASSWAICGGKLAVDHIVSQKK